MSRGAKLTIAAVALVALPAIAFAGAGTGTISQPISGQTDTWNTGGAQTNSKSYSAVPNFTDIDVSNPGASTFTVSADMRKGSALFRIVPELASTQPAAIEPAEARFKTGSNSFTFASTDPSETYTLEWKRVGKDKAVAAAINVNNIGEPQT